MDLDNAVKALDGLTSVSESSWTSMWVESINSPILKHLPFRNAFVLELASSADFLIKSIIVSLRFELSESVTVKLYYA